MISFKKFERIVRESCVGNVADYGIEKTNQGYIARPKYNLKMEGSPSIIEAKNSKLFKDGIEVECYF